MIILVYTCCWCLLLKEYKYRTQISLVFSSTVKGLNGDSGGLSKIQFTQHLHTHETLPATEFVHSGIWEMKHVPRHDSTFDLPGDTCNMCSVSRLETRHSVLPYPWLHHKGTLTKLETVYKPLCLIILLIVLLTIPVLVLTLYSIYSPQWMRFH